MSVRTTVTLDEDVLERVKAESKSRGTSFRETLNELVRIGLVTRGKLAAQNEFRVKPTHMGLRPGLNYDCAESLIEFAEGPDHK